MKSKKELNVLKEEVETLNKKLAELNEEELAEVVGGIGDSTTIVVDDGITWLYESSFDAQPSKGTGAWYGISNSEIKTEN